MSVQDGDSWPKEVGIPLIYGATDEFPSGHWIVSIVEENRVGATETIVVSKETGAIVVHGPVGE